MNKRISGASLYLSLVVLVILGIRFFSPPAETIPEVDVTEFINYINEENITKITYDEREIIFETKDEKTYFTVIPQEARI
ncbi:MAG: ATP-dependent metallopeptidase FtsH/Yme1/Tma family protein, partial [Peptoniphilus sp.]|nr:ATP-dependent metallopeptidase FtsH/Yme1/Tma family protein [Peptoniphilus sp.]